LPSTALYADPEKAARKLIEIANSIEPVRDGRIFIELINWPFLSEHKGSPTEFKAGLEAAISRGFAQFWRDPVIHMPTPWTLSTIEVAIFLAVALVVAGAGTWASALG
jgi:hypothetical protein